jgi:hypothetical protein
MEDGIENSMTISNFNNINNSTYTQTNSTDHFIIYAKYALKCLTQNNKVNFNIRQTAKNAILLLPNKWNNIATQFDMHYIIMESLKNINIKLLSPNDYKMVQCMIANLLVWISNNSLNK